MNFEHFVNYMCMNWINIECAIKYFAHSTMISYKSFDLVPMFSHRKRCNSLIQPIYWHGCQITAVSLIKCFTSYIPLFRNTDTDTDALSYTSIQHALTHPIRHCLYMDISNDFLFQRQSNTDKETTFLFRIILWLSV